MIPKCGDSLPKQRPLLCSKYMHRGKLASRSCSIALQCSNLTPPLSHVRHRTTWYHKSPVAVFVLKVAICGSEFEVGFLLINFKMFMILVHSSFTNFGKSIWPQKCFWDDMIFWDSYLPRKLPVPVPAPFVTTVILRAKFLHQMPPTQPRSPPTLR